MLKVTSQHSEVHCPALQNATAVYSPLAVFYNALAAKESVPTLCKSLTMRLWGISNPPFALSHSL